MNNLADAKSVPPELLSVIFRYLSEKDVSSCSKVCIKWREETNRNELWRQFCNWKGWSEGLNLHPIFSISIPQHVEPYFQAPDSSHCAQLTPLCTFYLNFLRCNHLYRNWWNGNYVIQTFNESILENFGDVTAVDLNNELVVLGCDGGIVVIWEQTQRELKYLEQVNCVFDNAVISHILLEGSSFIVLQLGLLQVFLKTSNIGYSLCYVKAMVAEDIVIPDLLSFWPVQRSFDEWFTENLYERFDDNQFRHARSSLEPVVAFWGTRTGVEILSFKPSVNLGLTPLNLPLEYCSVADVCFYRHDNLVYIALNFTSKPSVIVEYCLEKNASVKHFELLSNVLYVRVGFNLLVSLGLHGFCYVWNRHTGEKLNSLQCSTSVSQSVDFEVFGDTVYYESNSKVEVVKNCIQDRHVEFEIGSDAYYLTKGIGDIFVAARGKNVEIWSRKDKSCLYHIQDILIEGQSYSAVQYCDSCIALSTLNSPPSLIWFW